jgi:hypothetical protein
MNFRHKEIYQSLLLDYGLNDSFGITAKRGVQERFLPQDNARSHETRFGFTLNTPAIATGLLLPYVFRLAKSWLPVKQIKREKRVSMTLGWHNGRDEYWTASAQADRISVGRFRVTQEAEFDLRARQRPRLAQLALSLLACFCQCRYRLGSASFHRLCGQLSGAVA